MRRKASAVAMLTETCQDARLGKNRPGRNARFAGKEQMNAAKKPRYPSTVLRPPKKKKKNNQSRSDAASRSYTLRPQTRLFMALDLNPRSSGGDRLRWGVCSLTTFRICWLLAIERQIYSSRYLVCDPYVWF
jgi:hypothetical protein